MVKVAKNGCVTQIITNTSLRHLTKKGYPVSKNMRLYAKHMEIIKLLPYYNKVMGQKKDRANCATICCCQSGRVSKFAFLKKTLLPFCNMCSHKSSSVLCQKRPLMSKFANQRKPKMDFFHQQLYYEKFISDK